MSRFQVSISAFILVLILVGIGAYYGNPVSGFESVGLYFIILINHSLGEIRDSVKVGERTDQRVELLTKQIASLTYTVNVGGRQVKFLKTQDVCDHTI